MNALPASFYHFTLTGCRLVSFRSGAAVIMACHLRFPGLRIGA